MTDHILVSQTSGVCELRLNRPEKRNAITLAMYDTLWDAVVRAEADESVRVILLSGAGASFTAGNDLGDFMNGPPMGRGAQRRALHPPAPQDSQGSDGGRSRLDRGNRRHGAAAL